MGIKRLSENLMRRDHLEYLGVDVRAKVVPVTKHHAMNTYGGV